MSIIGIVLRAAALSILPIIPGPIGAFLGFIIRAVVLPQGA